VPLADGEGQATVPDARWRRQPHEPADTLPAYPVSGGFASATFQDWESESLQMLAQR
jgi:hypothetical protein